MANHPPSHYPDIGQLGEDLVAQWLQSTGWLILHRRFCCRWGEIDIIAQYQGQEAGEQRGRGAEANLLGTDVSSSGQAEEQGSRGAEAKFYSNCSPLPLYPSAPLPLPTQHLELAFVEVKTRSPGNWDAGGRSSITPQKQAKLWRTAQAYLTKYAEKADYPCRFDVAIVCCQQISKSQPGMTSNQDALFSLSLAGYEFTLQEYIPAAFDSLIE